MGQSSVVTHFQNESLPKVQADVAAKYNRSQLHYTFSKDFRFYLPAPAANTICSSPYCGAFACGGVTSYAIKVTPSVAPSPVTLPYWTITDGGSGLIAQ